MKPLSNGEQVPARMFCYLLDWNEKDQWKTLFDRYKVKRLYDLNKKQFKELFNIATKQDLKL